MAVSKLVLYYYKKIVNDSARCAVGVRRYTIIQVKRQRLRSVDGWVIVEPCPAHRNAKLEGIFSETCGNASICDPLYQRTSLGDENN